MAAEKKFLGVDIEGGVNAVKDASINNFDIDKWAVEIENRVNEASEERPCRRGDIFKVPAILRDDSPDVFTPQLVSFGPYHHGDGKLMPMEVHKKRALVEFIRRAGRPLEELINAVGDIIGALQDSYYDLDEKWRRNKDEFLALMITDGCFMYEVLWFAALYHPQVDCGFSAADPLFSLHGMLFIIPCIRRDLVLIENQTPLLLLKTLDRFQSPQRDKEALIDAVNRFFNVAHFSHSLGSLDGAHLLHAFRQSWLGDRPFEFTPLESHWPYTGRPASVVKLSQAGVKFGRSPISHGLGGIRFDPETGILHLPQLVLDVTNGLAYINIMAYESLHDDVDKDVSTFVHFMGGIIASEDDVILLREIGIIQGGIAATADPFRRFSNSFMFRPMGRLWYIKWQLDKFCRGRRTRCTVKMREWRVNLLRTYFQNPWTALSLAGALILLGLTIVQTVFAILQYRQGN